MSKPLSDAVDRLAALTDFEHNLVITAGAGTGKTSLLCGRVLTGLLGREIPPEAFLVTTFTEKAAAEMAERIEEGLTAIASAAPEKESDAGRALQVLGEEFGVDSKAAAERAMRILEGDGVAVSTFHSFCLGLLQDHAREAQLPPTVDLVDASRLQELFHEVWLSFLESELGSEAGALSPDAWASAIEVPGLRTLKELARSYCQSGALHDAPWERPASFDREALTKMLEALRQALLEDEGIKGKTREKLEAANKTLSSLLEANEEPDGEAVQGIAEALDLSALRFPPKTKAMHQEAWVEPLKAWKKRALKPAIRAEQLDFVEALCRSVLQDFQTAKRQRGVLAFDDLLSMAKGLLSSNEELRRKVRDRYQQVLVDEVQDTDPLQYEIVRLLVQGDAPEPTLLAGRLCMVGDPKQSIYRFRGADISAYSAMMQRVIDSPAGRQLSLRVNFRSHAGIIDFVNASCAPIFEEPKRAQAEYVPLIAFRERPEGLDASAKLLRIRTEGKADELRLEEARILAEHLAQTIRSGKRSARDFALLFRVFTDASFYAEALRNAGVPLLMIGGKHYYQRFEVQRLLALLTALVRPHDGAAVLACLRGPVFAVPDTELCSARSHKTAPTDWILAHPDEIAQLPEPALRSALLRLRALREDVLDLPPIDAVRKILLDSPIGAIEAAGYEGAQRFANLESFLDRIPELESATELSSVLELFDRELAGAGDAEESALAESDSDAVRLLTVHRAKGLEFPVVVLPDLLRKKKQSSSSGDALSLFRPIGEEKALLTYRWAGGASASDEQRKEEEQEHADAESTRLLYVALTRARDEVLLVDTRDPMSSEGKKPGLWMQQLEISFYAEDSEERAAGWLGVEIKEILPKEDSAKKEPDSKAQQEQLSAAREKGKQLEQAMAKALRSSFQAPSSAELPFEGASEKESHGAPLGRAVGTFVHRVLEFGGRAKIPEASLEAILQSLAKETAVPKQPLAEAAEELLLSFEASPLADRLADAKVLGHEVPLLYRDKDGGKWRGSIDLVIEEEGEIIVVDYKTDRIPESGTGDLVARYRPQIEIYARALQTAWSLPSPPQAELWFLRKLSAERVTIGEE